MDNGPLRGDDGVLSLGGLPLSEAVREVGTPAYVYDLDAITNNAKKLVAALGNRGLCCYAIKANGAAPIVRALVSAGCGVDVVSGGELELALACGARPESVVYSGVAKRDDELDLALSRGIRAIHAESVEELERITARARAAGVRGRVGLRVNPAVEADTHAHIATGHDEAKFGIAREDLPRALAAARDLDVIAVSSHVGSQLMTTEPYVAALRVLIEVAGEMSARGCKLSYIDAGGGYGVPYRDDQKAVDGALFVRAARETLDAAGMSGLTLVIEPGRYLVAPYGVLVSRVIQPKRAGTRRWLLIDAGMNDLIRPALYQAHHRIVPLTSDKNAIDWRVCGPVCESSDDFGVHPLPDPPPELVAIREAGAYGRSMASTYNVRPYAAEVFLAGGRIAEARRSIGTAALVAREAK